MWVAGTLGAFFTAIVRTIPIDIQRLQSGPDAGLILDRALRYGYLLWLLSYFFITNLRLEQGEHPSRRDLVFDVIQSVAGLSAAYALGFVSETRGFGPHESAGAIISANLTILSIALIAFYLFRSEADRRIHQLRFVGAILAAASILTASVVTSTIWMLTSSALFLLALWVTLWRYIRLRLRPESPSRTSTL